MEQLGEDLNLSFLLEHERDMILKVLQKDEKLRKREEKRIRKLKNELLEIKRKGSRRPQDLGDRQCERCLKNLGLIFDRGDLCEECKLRVCNDCRTVAPSGRQWRCSVCAKMLELKVVTGEWFLEERSKRFEEGGPCSEVIKQTILSSPVVTEKRTAETLSGSTETESSKSNKSEKSAVRRVVDGVRRKGLKLDKRGGRPVLKPENGVDSASLKSASDGDALSVYSTRSGPPPRSRGGVVALESSGTPTVPNNLRSQTLDRPSTPSNGRRPDGAESVASLHSNDNVSEKKAEANHCTDPDAPTISVSRASVSSDHSRSEMDLSAPASEPSEDAFSLRSRSVPGLDDAEFSDEEEDIDALMSAHSGATGQRLSNTVSAVTPHLLSTYSRAPPPDQSLSHDTSSVAPVC